MGLPDDAGFTFPHAPAQPYHAPVTDRGFIPASPGGTPPAPPAPSSGSPGATGIAPEPNADGTAGYVLPGGPGDPYALDPPPAAAPAASAALPWWPIALGLVIVAALVVAWLRGRPAPEAPQLQMKRGL